MSMSKAIITESNPKAAARKPANRPQSRWAAAMKVMKANKSSYILMAPYMLLFATFTVLPVLMSILISFTYFNMLELPRFIGWQNYSRLFLEDDIFLIAIKNTLLFAAVTGPLSYLACFVFAWIINELPPKLRAFMTLVFYAPSISGNVYFIWLMIFSGDRYGIVNGLLLKWAIIVEPIQWLKTEKYILAIIILVQLWLSLGTGFLAFIAGLQTVDKTLYEAGAVDGVKNRWQELWYITLPSMKPQLMFGAVIQLTTSFAVADVSINLAGFPSVNYAAQTIVTHLMDYGTIRFEMGYASAIATLLFILMVGTNLLVQRLLRKVGG
jgi:multiple sugar transport system permease protein